MIKAYLQGWNIMRLIRLALGIIILVQGIGMRDAVYSMMGVFLSALAFLNIGCCGAGGCSVPSSYKSSKTLEETDYEEVGKK